MTQRFFEIAQIGPGTLFIGPRPRNPSLNSWCDALVELRIEHVISFIGNGEVEDYRLNDEGLRLSQRNIGFTHFPIEDYGAPTTPGYRDLVVGHLKKLQEGESIFAHCAGGVGRAGTFASCLLAANGMGADAAMRLVTEKRGVNSPETEGQKAFVRAFRP